MRRAAAASSRSTASTQAAPRIVPDVADRDLEVEIGVDGQPVGPSLGQALLGVRGIDGPRRRDRAPARIGGDHATPFGKPRFAGVDLLPIADQGHDHGPAVMAAHDVERMRRLAHRQAGGLVAGAEDRLGSVPGALGFVEDDQPFRRTHRRVDRTILQEAVHVLQPRLGAPFGFRLRAVAAPHGVVHDRRPQHRDQRDIAGQEGGAVAMPGSEHGVQAAKRLAGAGDAGDEDHAFVAGSARRRDRAADRRGRARQAAGIGARGGDLGDAVPGVEHGRRFDDPGHRPIGRR
jgi:hypothetical protein